MCKNILSKGLWWAPTRSSRYPPNLKGEQQGMKKNERTVSVATYTRRIEFEEQSAYIEVPFEMPERVEEIHIAYEVVSHGEGKAVIDLGVRDSKRLRGWSGGARTEFWIGLEKATPGYIPGELAPGSWAVVHN